MHELNGYFDYLLSNKISVDMKIQREFPNYKDIIKMYRNVWQSFVKNELNRTFKETEGKKLTERYYIPYNLPGNEYVEIKFNIDKLNSILSDNNLVKSIRYDKKFQRNYFDKKDYIKRAKTTINDECLEDLKYSTFNKEFIKSILDKKEVDKEYAITSCLNNNNPIICIDLKWLTANKKYPFDIIDGNHRAYAKLNSDKFNVIDGYLLGRNMWIKGLLTEQDKLLVKLMNNVNIMLNYMVGNITLTEAKMNMYDIR